MTDIVERLRARAWNSMNEYVGSPEGPTASYTARDFENGALMQDAADEITRLRSRVAELENGLTDTLSMLRAAHMQCGIHHAGNKRVIKARSLLSQSTENGK